MCYRYVYTIDPELMPEPGWLKIKYEGVASKSFKEISSLSSGVSASESVRLRRRFGDNSLAVPVPSYFKLFYTEVIHPFYIFQIVSVIIWMTDEYYIYSGCIIVMAVASAIYGVWQARKNREMLADMTKTEHSVRILRKLADDAAAASPAMHYVRISSTEIAPGDLVEITPDMNLPCDMLLIRGQCVINESSLTGESVPVAKVSIPAQETEIFHPDVHGGKHMLFNGTSVLQTRPDLSILTSYRISSTQPTPGDALIDTTGLGNIDGVEGALYDGKLAKNDNTDSNVLGLAIRTGFSTAKGDLVRSIMFPRPTRFKFYRDSMRFVGVLFLISLISFVYTIIIFRYWHSPIPPMIHRALDLITIAVPPALPIAMSIATAFAIQRLKRKSIFCTSPQRVNVCGRIDVMCFDKTGTLTEDHLDVHGILPSKQLGRGVTARKTGGLDGRDVSEDFYSSSLPANDSMDALPISSSLDGDSLLSPDPRYASSSSNSSNTTSPVPRTPSPAPVKATAGYSTFAPYLTDITQAPSRFLHALACCHSLNMHHGQLIGDPLEVKMFEGTNWTLVDSGLVQAPDGRTSITTLKFFEFSSLLQRMSVIVEMALTNGATTMAVVAKGAPEVIKTLCDPSTLPLLFDHELHTFTQQGKRVLALATKPLDHLQKLEASQLTRAEAETRLCFLGLFVLQNQLKDDTTEAILNLRNGSVANVMVTGDNEYTAINVARQCGILPERPTDADPEVYLITLKQDENRGPILVYTHVPGFDPSGPDGAARRNTTVDAHDSASENEAPTDLLDDDYQSDNDDEEAQKYPSYGTNARVIRQAEFDKYRAGQDDGLPSVDMTFENIPHKHRQFAVHGKAFDYIRTTNRDLFGQILREGRVYARMSPLDKAHLMEGLQTLGYTVGMCGDGANDGT